MARQAKGNQNATQCRICESCAAMPPLITTTTTAGRTEKLSKRRTPTAMKSSRPPPRRRLPLRRLLPSLACLLLLLAATSSAEAEEGATARANARPQAREAQFSCDIPTNGCENGMFNVEKCVCECIPPYCPYSDGTCTLPSGNCGGNPWADCTRGVNCPWWKNPMKGESCTTGPEVPGDGWPLPVLFNTRKACCSTNFVYSEICDATPEPESVPTKFPTITVPEEDDFEVIPIKFELHGMPDDVGMRDLKDQMATVLKRILIKLSERIKDLRITEVEEKVILTDRLRNLRRAMASALGGGVEDRGLEQVVSLYYNVYAVRADGKRFGPIIIQELRDNYDDMITQIQAFTDTSYFGGDINLNLCTSEYGKFTNCLHEIRTGAPTPAPVPSPRIAVFSEPEPDDKGGLATWAIVLIVLVILVLLCVVGYVAHALCSPRGDGVATKDIQNNIYFDERGVPGDSESRGHRSRRSRPSDHYSEASDYDDSTYRTNQTGGRSRRTKNSRQIVLAGSVSPSEGDGSFTIDTGTRRDDPSVLTVNTHQTNGTRRQGRDPTMYVPGQEDRPDPDSDRLMLTNGDDAGSRRYYVEDPPIKPKRDPTMYVAGDGDPSGNGDPPMHRQRDPTMYVEGREEPSVYVEGQEDPSFVDQDGPETYAENGRDPSMYHQGQRDPTRYEEDGYYGYDDAEFADPSYAYDVADESCRTKSPDGSRSRASSAKRSKKSKKKSRR